MIRLTLLPHAEKLAPSDPLGLGYRPLYHQVRTAEALRDHHLVVNTYDTGTGKTKAALLGLLDPDRRKANVLFIAPTNELIRQHVRDVKEFVDRYRLPHTVLHVDASTVRSMTAPEGREQERPGERLNRLFNNPRDYGWDGNGPLVVVTNPDIFYYALYVSAYNPHDQRNLLEQFLTRFDYVIIDEFHYYSPKQLSCFLFFFILCREWGYLNTGRRLCLLSATPDQRVRDYLDRIFPDSLQVAWISPDNEPEESTDYPLTPALAPLTLEVQEGTIDDFAENEREQLARWLDEHQDGALISSALGRINRAFDALRSRRFEGRVRRLTGAESSENRRTAPNFPLILATPTVDIGYNFGKPGKERQPLDFVVFEARTRDEFLQRLGRAGRVLGRRDTDCPSHAVALLDTDVYAGLRFLDGQTLSRRELHQKVSEFLPPRNDLYAYIHSYAVLEAFRPIFILNQMVRSDLKEWVEKLFETVLEVFVKNNRSRKRRWYFGSLITRMRRHKALEEIVRKKEYGKLTNLADEYIDWLRAAEIPPEELEEISRRIRKDKKMLRCLLLPWAKERYHLDEALFKFRDTMQGPVALAYDPKHLLADADLTSYDALHVVENFHADYFESAELFRSACDLRGEIRSAEVYCHLKKRREKKERIYLGFYMQEPRMQREMWERLYTNRPVALTGLRVRAEPSESLPRVLLEMFKKQFIVLLAVAEKDSGRLRYLLKNNNLFYRNLWVQFRGEPDYSKYIAIVGSQAFIIHAEMENYFFYKEKELRRGPIII